MELYTRRGFEQTTVAEIAKRAGLTERTFFRYFADKREVLFGGSTEFEELVVSAVVDAPESATPIEAVEAGLQAAAAMLQERRGFSRQRQKVIAANAELREREIMKLVSLASTLAQTLRDRGVPEPTASLAAEVGVAVFRTAFEIWVSGEDCGLPALISETLGRLSVLAADERKPLAVETRHRSGGDARSR